MRERDEQFREFVAEHAAGLLRLAHLLAGERAAAEDLLQIALMRTYRRWGRIHTDPDGYTRRVLVTTAADEGRRAHRRRERVGGEPPDAPDPHDAIDQSDDRDRLRAALRGLPPGQRAAVVLRHWLDLDAAAAAELLGCSEQNVRSQASRGLAKLRTAYELPAKQGRGSDHE